MEIFLHLYRSVKKKGGEGGERKDASISLFSTEKRKSAFFPLSKGRKKLQKNSRNICFQEKEEKKKEIALSFNLWRRKRETPSPEGARGNKEIWNSKRVMATAAGEKRGGKGRSHILLRHRKGDTPLLYIQKKEVKRGGSSGDAPILLTIKGGRKGKKREKKTPSF